MSSAGTSSRARPVVAGSGGAGILITSFNDTAAAPPDDNQITENSIYNNFGLGIDLDARTPIDLSYVGDGVTPNDGGDVDPGGNELQNYPDLGAAVSNGTDVTITGTLDVPLGWQLSDRVFRQLRAGPEHVW